MIKCNFCGKSTEDDKLIIQGKDDNYICLDCVKDLYLNNIRYKHKLNMRKKKVTPSYIKEYLDKYIIGQDNAKKILSIAVYNHYKAISLKKKDSSIELDKSNIVLVGPSGCGKTAILKALSKFLKVPFAMADATTFTEKGYVGNDVESVLYTLIQNADGNIDKAERGIVYIDEVDKLSKRNPSSNFDGVSCGREGVQQALLKMIEGSVVELPNKKRDLLDSNANKSIKIDTSNILFIVGGAFVGIDKIISKRINKNIHKIGYGVSSSIDKKNIKSYNDLIEKISPEDLKSFGIITELLGRLPIICSFKELNKEQLIEILTKPNNALLKQYDILLKEDGINLNFSNKALEQVAERAISKKTGARGLRSILESILQDLMYKAPELDYSSTNILIDYIDDDFKISKIKSEQEAYKGEF